MLFKDVEEKESFTKCFKTFLKRQTSPKICLPQSGQSFSNYISH